MVRAQMLKDCGILVAEMEIQDQNSSLIGRQKVRNNFHVFERHKDSINPGQHGFDGLPMRWCVRIDSTERGGVLGMASIRGSTEDQLRGQHVPRLGHTHRSGDLSLVFAIPRNGHLLR